MKPTLAETLWPGARDSWGAKVAIVLGGTLLLALSARVQVPFWPVPMTMQTLVVLMLGAGLGARLAGATLAAYLMQGAAGLPVFTAGGGAHLLMGPTAGYLWGFLLAAALVGWLADRGACRSALSTLGAFLAGTAVIFALGVVWLAMLFGWQTAIATGVMPFLLSEALKIAIATALMPLAWARVRG